MLVAPGAGRSSLPPREDTGLCMGPEPDPKPGPPWKTVQVGGPQDGTHLRAPKGSLPPRRLGRASAPTDKPVVPLQA